MSGPQGLGSKNVIGDQSRLRSTYLKEFGLYFVAGELQLRAFEEGRNCVLGESFYQHFEEKEGFRGKWLKVIYVEERWP